MRGGRDLDRSDDQDSRRGRAEAQTLDGGRVRVSRGVAECAKRHTVVAGDAVRGGGGGGVVLMGDVRDRIQRERKQHRCEGDSQPVRRTTGEL
jgi:hypothetical protein